MAFRCFCVNQAKRCEQLNHNMFMFFLCTWPDCTSPRKKSSVLQWLCHVLCWSLSHQFFIRFPFPIRCWPQWTKVRQTNNKLGKGATNISAKTCFSASHSLVPTPFSSLAIFSVFFSRQQ